MKKEKKNKKIFYGKANYNEEMERGIKIFLGVAILLALIYLATAFLTGEIRFNHKETSKKTETTIQYEEILAGESFNRAGDNYYVMYFSFTDPYATVLMTAKDVYKKTGDKPVYIVDLDKGFNTWVLAKDEEQFQQKPSSVNDLKVKGPTLLEISKKKVTKRVEGKDEIKKAFEDAAK